MRIFSLLTLTFLAKLSLFSNSLMINNNSPHYLRVRVIGADGTDFGETIMAPQAWVDWTDDNMAPTSSLDNPTASQTPYTVHWYCGDGSDYAICSNIQPGSGVFAQSCIGNCQCKSTPFKKSDEEKLNGSNAFSVPPQYPPEEPAQQ